MSNLWNEEPGQMTLLSVQEMLGERLGGRVIASLPSNFQGAIDVAKMTKAAISAITAAAAGGPLAIVGAVYAGLTQIDSALSGYAKLVRDGIQSSWISALTDLSNTLVKNANGNILANYQPADSINWSRAQSYTSKKKGKYGLVGSMEKQFRSGYVMGVKRPARSDYIVSTVPILVYRGGVLGSAVPQSIYSDPGKDGYIGTVDDTWGKANTWQPMGLVPWSGGPVRDWVELSVQLKNAHGSPPIRQKIKVAPGLAPYWGPYGEEQPLSSVMAAYAAALLSNPPPDLDYVAGKIAEFNNKYAKSDPVDPRETGILELLWSREDLARRGNPAAGKPKGDEWPGPFMSVVYGPAWDPVDTSDGEDTPQGGSGKGGGKGGGGGMGGKGVGGIDSGLPPSTGGGAALALGGLLAGGLYLRSKRGRR